MSTIKVNALRHTGGSSDNINLDSSGRVLIGTSSSVSVSGDNQLQVFGEGLASSVSLTRSGATTQSANLTFGRTRGDASSRTVLNSDDTVGRIHFAGDDGTDMLSLAATIQCNVDGTPGSNDMPGRLSFSTTADGASSPTEAMRIDSSQNLRFNSGYGSVATAYGVRAWVQFRGDITSSGNSQINGSGNVSSVTDNGTGDYTVNFTNAMPDTNYIAFGNVMEDTGGFKGDHNLYMYRRTPVTGSVRVNAVNLAGNVVDDDYVYVGVIR